MNRKHIIFSGCVQGVGFRWRARKAAEMYGVTGWVRNDWNGTVTMEVQGTEEQILKSPAPVSRHATVPDALKHLC